jgi:Radical SAM superfamily/B12 binding domain
MKHKKILLTILPFWTPLIPPIGLASLKTYLDAYDFSVTQVDVALEKQFRERYYRYFDILKSFLPPEKLGNFYSIGHDVLRNHLMAHLRYDNEDNYCKLIRYLIRETFYEDAPDEAILTLNQEINFFYQDFEDYFVQLLTREKPDVLGVSVFSDTLPASIFAFKLTREKFPHIKTVMGGGVFADHMAVGSPNLEKFLLETEPYIDYVIMGEGEILFRNLLADDCSAEQRVFTLEDINWELMNLAEAKMLDFSGIDLQKYPYMVSYTSRSCPFQCSFCSETVQWGKYRKKKTQQVVNELTMLYENSGRQLFMLSDSLLNPVLMDLSDRLSQSQKPIYWEGWLRVEDKVMDIQNTFLWRRSGFYHARIGVESGSQHVLDLMNKKITLQQIKESLSSLALAGIKTTTLWVIGHPGETEEDFQQTLDLLEEYADDIYEAECRPFYYYLTGQSNSGDDWWKNTPKIPLFPPEMEEMLLFQTWMLDCEPSRTITYDRVNRFVAQCRKLGIPNPYSQHEIYKADIRWSKLHKNAVPHLKDFDPGSDQMDECRHIATPTVAPGPEIGSMEFNF